jgi:NAD(P)-dependent dehydrogenase (short-subunit alcohol dehydrogenase family)
VNKPTDEIDLEDWNKVVSVNLTGVFLCTKHVIPYMRQAQGGSIVNLSSVYGLVRPTCRPTTPRREPCA